MLRRFVRRGLNASFLTHFNLLDTKIDLWYFDKPFINYNQMTMLNRVDPERQMEIVREYIRGNNSQDNAVAITRFAIKNARSPIEDENVNIGRTYTREELSEMESRLDRLEILVIRKRAGEIISPEEINRTDIQEEKEPIKTVQLVSKIKKEEPTTAKKKDTKDIEVDEIVLKINLKLDYAEILLVPEKEIIKNSKDVAREEIEIAIEMIERAEKDGINVEVQKTKLSELTQKYSDVLQSI